MKTVKKMKNTCHSIRFWQLRKNKFIRIAATDARLGIGFRMGGIHPTCGRPDRVGFMRKAFSCCATKGFVKKPMRGRMNGLHNHKIELK